MALTAPPSGPVVSVTPEVTTADLALFTGAPDGTELQEYVTSALDQVRSACGPLSSGQYRYLLAQPVAGRRLSLPRFPGVRMASLDALADPLGVDVLVQLATTDVNWRTGAVLAPYHLDGDWRLTATISRPADATTNLKLAVKIVAKNLWELHRGKNARPSAYGPDQAPAAPMWSGMPARAREIMKPYLQRPVG